MFRDRLNQETRKHLENSEESQTKINIWHKAAQVWGHNVDTHTKLRGLEECIVSLQTLFYHNEGKSLNKNLTLNDP